MVPPPKRVDAVEVKNTTAQPLKFRAVYDDHKDKKEIVEEFTVAPGSSHTFGEKELNMGTWTAVAPIKRVEADGPGGPHRLEPSVGGIVKLLQVSAAEAGGGVKLSQAH
ncbi:hypothetical protein HYH03_017970 [Edaphochlamys debaryana]|uniref:Uncharacterized protein n=1 Tax=Edaphochlamys debaryana TaxID=47281 RepID=A0A836BQ23_9CHLO|nr:hypothetical protein HYH03_017970 [Edaphochlamys debaryana]|eukprot:KAG2483178.1 hypothetical protein HYH03_017970 [Edaphochlamys debaryana]